MVHLKSKREIEIMAECGKKLKAAVDELIPQIKEGMTTNELDEKAKELIKKQGADTSFTKVKGYKWATCVPINEQIVHTPPSDRVLQRGDVLTVDIGAFFKGYHSDYADTIVIGGKTTPEIAKFLKIGKEALEKAIKQAKAGNRLGHISQSIEKDIKGNGYYILKELTGHGIGKELHEDPFVPGFLDKPLEKTLKIEPGLVIAIEIIYSMGTDKIAYERGDDWSIVTEDGSISACFEKTVAITHENTFILT